MSFYSVSRRRKDLAKHPKEQYEVVSYYGPDGFFRGQATFTNKKDAEAYLLLYQSRIEKRNQENNSHNGHTKITLDLKIIKSEEMPKLPIPVSFR
jgi:hypothetical protein